MPSMTWTGLKVFWKRRAVMRSGRKTRQPWSSRWMQVMKIWSSPIDLSVHHAAHQLEEDARDLVMEATFQELKAEMELEDATELLDILKRNERALKATIEEMRKEKNAELREKFETHEMPKHQDFVKGVRKILKKNLIDHDPTKGNVAF